MKLEELKTIGVTHLAVTDENASVRKVGNTGMDKPKGFMSGLLSFKRLSPCIKDGVYPIEQFEEVCQYREGFNPWQNVREDSFVYFTVSPLYQTRVIFTLKEVEKPVPPPTKMVREGVDPNVKNTETNYDDVMDFADRNYKYGKLLTEYGIPFTERTERILMGYTMNVTDLRRVAESKGITEDELLEEIRSKI